MSEKTATLCNTVSEVTKCVIDVLKQRFELEADDLASLTKALNVKLGALASKTSKPKLRPRTHTSDDKVSAFSSEGKGLAPHAALAKFCNKDTFNETRKSIVITCQEPIDASDVTMGNYNKFVRDQQDDVPARMVQGEELTLGEAWAYLTKQLPTVMAAAALLVVCLSADSAEKLGINRKTKTTTTTKSTAPFTGTYVQVQSRLKNGAWAEERGKQLPQSILVSKGKKDTKNVAQYMPEDCFGTEQNVLDLFQRICEELEQQELQYVTQKAASCLWHCGLSQAMDDWAKAL